MMIRPIRNQILVKPCESDEVSAGGIIVPESFRERSSKAKIVAVGGGTKDRPMRYKPTYTVWHIKGAGVEIYEDNEKYFLMPDNEVLGYLEN